MSCVTVHDALKWNLHNEWWAIEGKVTLWFIFGKATWNICINIINICNDIYEKRLFEHIKSSGIQCESKIHVHIINIL